MTKEEGKSKGKQGHLKERNRKNKKDKTITLGNKVLAHERFIMFVT
jgi:hypothetical protein